MGRRPSRYCPAATAQRLGSPSDLPAARGALLSGAAVGQGGNLAAQREAESAAREARAAARCNAASPSQKGVSGPAAAAATANVNAGKVPREMRSRLKRAKAARGLLQDLEEEMRRFVQGWERKQARRASAGLLDADSSEEDEEILFVGPGGRMMDMPPSPKARRHRDVVLVEAGDALEGEGDREILQKHKLVYDGLVGN